MKLPNRLWRIKEVQRVARRRGVDDDQVPFVLGEKLTQLLHRHVLLRAGERRGDGLVELVVQNRFAAFGSGVLDHHLVERPAHVEHHGVQFAGHLGRQRNALRRVAEILDAERLGEPLGRVDGQHHDRAAIFGGAQRHCRGGGGLADTARAAAHHDAVGRVAQDRAHVQGGCVW